MQEEQAVQVELSADDAATLQAAVDRGEYPTLAYALSAAVQVWEWQRLPELEAETARLRALWNEGVASGPGQPVDMANLREQLRRELQLAERKIA